MQEVALLGIELYSYHGYYEEEQRIGNKYIVDIKVITGITSSTHDDDLAKTIDYVQLYAIIKNEMEIPSKLLEHVAGRISDAVHKSFPIIKETIISIAKQNPPIGGICKESKVTISKKY